MEDNISRLEFWILNSCSLHEESIRALGWDDLNFVTWFGRYRPTSDLAELANVLMSLFLRGDLTSSWDSDGEDWKQHSFCPSRTEVDSVISRTPSQRDLWYYLTPQGGARWETAANPDWSKYVEARWKPYDEDCVRFEYQATSTEYEAVGIDVREEWFCGRSFKFDTARWCIIRGWKATYWKTVPLAYRLTGAMIQVAPEPSTFWLRRRYTWYTDPWQEPWARPPIPVPAPDQPFPESAG